MNFVLLKNFNNYAIVNDVVDFTVGYAYPLNGRYGPYRVRISEKPLDEPGEVGIVASLDDVIPAFLAYYEKVQGWDRLGHTYYKFTPFGHLRVKQGQQGEWLAYRSDFQMLRDGAPARFTTCLEAQRRAEVHELDLYPGAPAIHDGLTWVPDPEFNWRSIPHLVEGRAEWQRNASQWLP